MRWRRRDLQMMATAAAYPHLEPAAQRQLQAMLAEEGGAPGLGRDHTPKTDLEAFRQQAAIERARLRQEGRFAKALPMDSTQTDQAQAGEPGAAGEAS